MISISYGITVCNELEEITKLIDVLKNNIKETDEIVIQYDEVGVTDSVMDYLKIVDHMHDNVKIIGFPLNKDFSTFKNNLKKHCTKDYIFQIDADEIPNDFLLQNLSDILTSNEVDLIHIPRVNTVEGLTDEHIQKWRWNVDEKGWVNWPDYQTRIVQNNPKIQWASKVHEVLVGHENYALLPQEEEWCLYHPKDIKRQEFQNDRYNQIGSGQL